MRNFHPFVNELSGHYLADTGFELGRVLRHRDRAEIIAEMQIAGRLHAGENTGMETGHGRKSSRFETALKGGGSYAAPALKWQAISKGTPKAPGL